MEKKDNSFVYGALGFLGVIVVGVIALLVYKFVFNNKDYVIDAYNNSYTLRVRDVFTKEEINNYSEEELDTLLGYDIKIPKIDLDTEDAKKINNDIYDLIKGYTNDVDNRRNIDNFFMKYDYEYKILDDIIFIQLNYIGYAFPGGGTIEQYLYYYDIKTNKELKNEDIMKRFNINSDMINEKLNNPDECFIELSKFYPKDDNTFIVYVPTNEYEGNEKIEIKFK